VPSPNPIREALSSRRFSYIVELVASAKTTEEKLQEMASELAQVPGLIAAGVTSYAGGSAGHDPIRIGEIVKERGLTPNVHLTCVNHSRQELIQSLFKLRDLGIENVFAITGDYPKAGTADSTKTEDPKADYDIDSVQLVELIQEMRQQGLPFHTSVAVSPFKYTEADCAYQYLKLEKKIAAGADFAITQLGYDVPKFRELKRYLDERGLKTPVFGNVYILSAGAAKKFAKAEPPGCWVSPELLDRVQEEAKAPDKGLAARLERAARTVAVLRGLGYAGAYIGGDHQAERIKWIIQRSEEIASNWEEYAEEIVYGAKNGFYFFESPREKKALPLPLKVLDGLAAMFPVKHEHGPVRKALAGVMSGIDKLPGVAHALERFEFAFKSPAFGCQSCGNCVLGDMEYVCPMTCPKSMRNGPCGGTFNGQCEVYPDRACIWVKVYEHAQAANRVDDLKTYIPPRNRALQGTSSWINLFLERDNRPGHAPPLVNITPTK
jgi:methylenetetrahydrofolate reductase (NADPH)